MRLPRGAEAARLPSMATFDSDGPAWTATERTRRTVALNPPEALQDLLQLVASILSKILDNPGEDKYRSLKQSGRVCQQRLLGRPGGRELLASLGFKSDERADAIALSSVDDAKLRAAVAWCASFQPPSPHVALVIRLPSGARLEAAFSTDETLRDVRAYADACARHADSAAGGARHCPGAPRGGGGGGGDGRRLERQHGGDEGCHDAVAAALMWRGGGARAQARVPTNFRLLFRKTKVKTSGKWSVRRYALRLNEVEYSWRTPHTQGGNGSWCVCVHVSPCPSEVVVEWVRVRVKVRVREITIVGWGFTVTQ